jgi:trehalose-6-phosphate synthase
LAKTKSKTLLHPALINTEFVLSVDRADYTKGVIPRMEAIHHFFNDHPQMIGKITFAQLCTQTRPGLEAFDNYWNDIQRMSREINAKYKNEDWQPIHNLKGPLSPKDLSVLYGHASVMLVNPLRDGLNLTAKEYVACQSRNPGALMLSAHAGAYEELGQWTTNADPFDTRGMGHAVFEALHLPASEKKSRMQNMLAVLKANTISSWCDQFKFLLEPQADSELVATEASG